MRSEQLTNVTEMPHPASQVAGPSERSVFTVALGGLFTLEPVQDRLAYWLNELHIPHRVTLAPFSQLLRELIDPAGLFGTNRRGANVALLRLSDLAPEETRRAAGAVLIEAVRRGAEELEALVVAYTQRDLAAPLLICFCPESPELLADADGAEALAALERRLAERLGRQAGLSLITSGELLCTYPLQDYADPATDAIAHLPYTPEFFAAIGNTVARRMRALLDPPYKALVLDCDGTLWNGVVGEDGVEALGLDAGRLALQQFVLEQQQAGMLIALCSKNEPEDIEAVFERREMPLRREHVVALRANWRPKSENLRSLAEELNLGLDSFIFLDDNPVECAEVRANCPEVFTVQLPANSADAAALLRHIWVFDRWRVTSDDRRRTEHYRAQAQRERLRKVSASLEEFLAGLALEIHVQPLQAGLDQDLARVSQLTFRTNQFNVTSLRRSEAELSQVLRQGLEALTVRVRDRFGDYGLVGVVLYAPAADHLKVDTLLLSCRVLGRGVEHRMIHQLGAIAGERGLAYIEIPFMPTARNEPAREFLLGLPGDWIHLPDGGMQVLILAEEAAGLVYRPGAKTAEAAEGTEAGEAPGHVSPGVDRRAVLTRIIEEVQSPEGLRRHLGAAAKKAEPRRTTAPVDARDPLERELAAIWSEILHVDSVGVTDSSFLDLGANSIDAAYVAGAIGARTGYAVSLATLLEHDTVERLAAHLRRRDLEPRPGPEAPHPRSLVPLRSAGHRPPLFLVRAAGVDGGRFMYLPLVRYLHPQQPVFVLINRPQYDGSTPFTSIEAMASEYVAAIRAVQPKGPYRLAGWCLGGAVAFEMANQLHAAGERTAPLVLFDPVNQGGRAGFIREGVLRFQRLKLRLLSRFPWLRRWTSHALFQMPLWARFTMLAYLDPDNDDVALIQLVFPGKFDAAALRALPPRDRWEHVYQRLKTDEPPVQYIGDSAETYRRAVQLLAVDHQLAARYRPKAAYPDDVHLFVIRGRPTHVDEWKGMLAKAPRVWAFDIHGTRCLPDPHDAMLDEENVARFAGAFQALLDQAEADTTR